MDMKYIFTVIDEIQDEWYSPPTCYYKRKKIDFEYQSYKHSAMNEIKIYLMRNTNEDPISVLENFRYKMDSFACKSKNGNANFMFSIYYDVVSDVLDVLLSMK